MLTKNYLAAIACVLFFGCSALTLKKQDKPLEVAATAPEFSAHALPTHAKFIASTEAKASRSIASTLTGQCVVTNPTCPAYGNAIFTGTFVDFTTTVYVPELQSFCAARPQEYFAACGEQPGSSVSSTYYENGQPTLVTTYPLPTPTPVPTVTPYVYVGAGANDLYQCGINKSTGALSACSLSAGAPANSAVGPPISGSIALGSNSFVYYDTPTALNVCAVAANGALTCQATAVNGSIEMGFLSTANAQYAFIPTGSSGFNECTVNPSSGQLSNCTTFQTPYGPTNAAQVFTTTAGASYLYYTVAANEGGAGVSQCNVNSGALDCSANLYQNFPTPPGPVYSVRSPGFTLQKIGSNTFAYLTEEILYGAPGYTGPELLGAIAVCLIDPPTGNFINCSTSSSSSWFPGQIAFNTVAGQTYAYFTSGNDVYQCSVNATTGALSSCVPSDGGIGVGSWSPKYITIINAP